MNLRFRYHRLILLLIIFSSACEEQDQEQLSYYQTLSPFNIIELNSVFDVFLIQDTLFALKIVASEKVVKNIAFTVQDGILRISNESNGKWLAPKDNKVTLYITSDLLTEIRPNATCFITTVNPIITDDFTIIMGHRPRLARIDLALNCKSFLYWNNHQCGGKVNLSGNAENLLVYTFALMSFDASQLTARYAQVENNSKGDCEVFVTDMLDYSIRGVGNIYLGGNPREVVLHERTSSGQLIHLN